MKWPLPLSSVQPAANSAADPTTEPAKASDRKKVTTALPTDCGDTGLSGIFGLLGRWEGTTGQLTEYVSRMTAGKI